MSEQEFTCECCGKAGQAPARYRQRFCGKSCAARARLLTVPMPDTTVARDTRSCPECSATFTVYPSDPKRYCSLRCAGVGNRAGKAEGLVSCSACATGWERTAHERRYGLAECKSCRKARRQRERPIPNRWRGAKPYLRAKLNAKTAGK